jgi:UDP-N-acetylmuramyl pentapeptide phosphotransferase/UDP-N-acetylglucosamine-1-phosphate transferase
MNALTGPFRQDIVAALAIVAAAAALTALLILWLKPILQRYALARPNARSSHTVPTPQGGGIAIIAAWLVVSAAALSIAGTWPAQPGTNILIVFAATVLMAILGAVDDIHPIAVIPRLLAQFAGVGCVIAILPADFQMTPFLPWWIERALLVVAGVWFVNLVNFMDGLDWMTVAEMVPLAAGLALLGALGALPGYAVLCALALLGALIGFAPFNKPVARLFLGDVGSLPLGLIVGWLLALLANKGHLAAALLLPLYYLMDATLTLLRRLLKGERVWQAHRTHFYQRATDNGFTVKAIVALVFALNVLLVALAALCIHFNTPAVEISALVAGVVATSLLLWRFSRKAKCAS